MLEKLRDAIHTEDIKVVRKQIAALNDILSDYTLSGIMLEQLQDILTACEEDMWAEAEDLLEVLSVDMASADDEEDEDIL